MFKGSRRRGAPIQPLTRETANANAATAAASAFMRSDANSSLSSAAAAAALKARPTSPINVADVQSKRALRRSPSVSSNTSRGTGRRREHARTPSVGSMIERTFRSPSPGRVYTPKQVEAPPPVPKIPNADHDGEDDKGDHGKVPILQTQAFRPASQKIKEGQGSWFGPAAAGDLSAVRHTNIVEQHSSRPLSEPRSGSVSPSINFSYPRARLQSPSGSVRSQQGDDPALIYDPNSRRMVPRVTALARSQSVQDFEELRTAKKKKKQNVSRTGSHLTKGTVGRTLAPALEDYKSDTSAQLQQNKTSSRLVPNAKDANGRLGNTTAPSENRSMTQRQGTKEPTGLKGSQVSNDTNTSKDEQDIDSKSVLQFDLDTTPQATENPNMKSIGSEKKSQLRGTQHRVQSESPARSTRFAASTDQLVIRHEPPPRSLSPRKSALKPKSPTRAASPSDDGSESSVLTPSADDAQTRRKSVRVSWNDRHTVVTEPAEVQTHEPLLNSSTPPKKAWHNIVSKYSKKESAPLESDETMSPRPTLPSFGSVREKKMKDVEERPLVRPNERTLSPPSSSRDLDAVDAMASAPQEELSRNEANISKYREPLPITTTVQKEDGLSSSDDDLLDDTSEDFQDSMKDISRQSLSVAGSTVPNPSGDGDGSTVPLISVSQPSPQFQQGETPKEHTDYIGSHANETDSSSTRAESSFDDFENASKLDESQSPSSRDSVALAAGLPMDDIKEEEEEVDLYTDAYEELSEVDGDGFLSLDAVLETPADSPLTKKTKEYVRSNLQNTTFQATGSHPDDGTDDWEKAKAYWKSLSSEKRRQLEKEALAETEEEASSPTFKQKPLLADDSAIVESESQARSESRIYQIQPGTEWEHTEHGSIAVNDGKAAVRPRSTATQKLEQASKEERIAQAASTIPAATTSMRKSMRSNQPATKQQSHIRKTIDDDSASSGAVRMKTSLRQRPSTADGNTARPAQPQTSRPSSFHPMPTGGGAKYHMRNMSNDSLTSSKATRSAGFKSSLRRRGSDSSESSFTRNRSGSGGGHEFRRSMRGSARPTPVSDGNDRDVGRFSLRSLSPTTTGFRRNSASSLPTSSSFGGGRMRQSLRGESVDAVSRKRMSGFGKSPLSKGKKASSRFADSSDEEEGTSNLFRSRFADSSDEDDSSSLKHDGKNLPKSLRGRADRAITTAANLRSSDDELTTYAMSKSVGGAHEYTGDSAPFALQRKRSGRGQIMPVAASNSNSGYELATVRPGSSRRGSFMSILRRRKEPASKISREVVESAARRDTRLERSPEELEILRNGNTNNALITWPLPDKGSSEDNCSTPVAIATSNLVIRPSTAAGPTANGSSKSKFLRRRSASQGMVGLDHHAPDGGHEQQKKKKFGALRKMFGIHD